MADSSKKRTDEDSDYILDDERFKIEDEEDYTEDVQMVNYVKQKHAYESLTGFFFSLISGVFIVLGYVHMVKDGMNPGYLVTVCGACSILWSVAGLVYSGMGLTRKNRKRFFSYPGLFISTAEVATMASILILGNK